MMHTQMLLRWAPLSHLNGGSALQRQQPFLLGFHLTAQHLHTTVSPKHVSVARLGAAIIHY
jgi:hypothetical protein